VADPPLLVLDDRFGFGGLFVRATPTGAAAAARRAWRQGLLEAWG
jgi:hypothetical protein